MNKRLEETPQSVIANVHKAAQLLKEKGSEALAVLTDPKSEFNNRDAYLFIIDVDKSLVVSNPRFPKRTGGHLRPVPPRCRQRPFADRLCWRAGCQTDIVEVGRCFVIR